MHELALTQSILAIAAEEADKHGAERILSITLKVGAYSGVMPQMIQEYFDITSQGTKAQGARLIIERTPVTISCPDCGGTYAIDKAHFNCPGCGGKNIKLLTGREFYIDSLEAE